MQRHEADGVIISCDFCGTDWDEVLPMIEGHHGSVICLDCLQQALAGRAVAAETFACTLCLRENLPPSLPRWSPEECPAAANPRAIVCQDCIDQAAKAFHRDPDVNWTWRREA